MPDGNDTLPKNLAERHVVGLYDLSKLTKDELITLIDNLREKNKWLTAALDMYRDPGRTYIPKEF